tara:strand:+ start:274 stop:618 length:345 start_codon:yes stop_codon:yes gene_type:complete
MNKTKKLISITSSALKQLKLIKNENNSIGILFSVKSGGCNGFEYNFKPINKFYKKDNIVVEDNLKIEICDKSLFYLLGTKIDWNQDIMGKRFIFENPIAQASCGCGTSFSVKNL